MKLKTVNTGNKNLICPCCKVVNDAASSTSGSMPKAGCIAVCYDCGTIAEYVADGDHLKLEKASNELLETLKKDDPENYVRLLLYSTAIAAKNQENSRRYS